MFDIAEAFSSADLRQVEVEFAHVGIVFERLWIADENDSVAFWMDNVIGSCLITPREIPNPYNLTTTARINGEEWSRGTTADNYSSFAEIVTYFPT